MKLAKKLLSLLLVLVMVLGLMPAMAMADGGGSIVMSFEMYDAADGTVALLRGPEKVDFTDSDTGLTLAKKLLGDANVNAPSGWITSFTIDGVEYTKDLMGNNGSWSLYKNNAEDGVTIDQYKPADGDVYRVLLTSYNATTYRFPVMTNDLDALYWAMAEYTGSLDDANALVQSAKPAQRDIDAMAASLSNAGNAHYVLIDGRSVQVDASGYPYKYTKTLAVDKTSAVKGETVTVTVTVPGGMALAEGYPKVNGVSLTKAGEGEYTFVMPDAHVALTVEFTSTDANKLKSAIFSYDAAGKNVIAITPEFNENVNEYSLTVYDYEFPKNSSKLYSTLTFDSDNATAKWYYYMLYSGYGYYADGPAASSGVAYGHRKANILSAGMTNGQKHRVDITPTGGVPNSYYFQMTALPTLSALTIDGAAVEGFAANKSEYSLIIEDTDKVVVNAEPFDDEYYVYINGSEDDAAGTDTQVALTDGKATITIVVDDDNGVTNTYTVSIKTKAAVAAEEQAKLDAISKLMDNIAAGYVDSSSEWVVMDMAAYAKLKPDAVSKTSAEAKQNYINLAIKSITAANAKDTTFDKAILALTGIGADVTELYPANSNTPFSAIDGLNAVTKSASAWNAPYTLMAYNQGDYGTDSYEQKVIEAVLARQNKNGSWAEYGDSIQTTSNVIAGLAFYYGKNDDVTAAIDKAIDYLSKAQKADGSFDAYGSGADGNTAAMVVIGLAAVGIDPAKDARFIKNGVSAMDSLMSFVVEGNDGFGYTDNSRKNPSATEQGFRAIIAAYQVMTTGKAYNVYDFSDVKVSPVRATGTGKVDTPEEPDESNPDIKVSFTIKAVNGYWINGKSVTVKEGSTVYHAFIKALEGTNITQVGAENGYVSSMSRYGETLGEFTMGPNSGWLYTVNGSLPNVGLTSYKIKDGDVIVFYYTEDWTEDELASRFQEEMVAEVIKLIDAIGDVTEKSGDAIKAAREAYDKLKDDLKKMVSNYDKLVAAEKEYAKLTGSMSYTDVSKGSWYYDAVLYAFEHDLMNGVGDGRFDPNGKLSRAMTAQILYRIAGSPAVSGKSKFTDVADGQWYTAAVIWAAENDIVKGMGDGTFAPNADITREQLAAMLMRYCQYKGYDVSGRADMSKYTDMSSAGAWAVDALKWACAEGLITGRTADTLAPKNTATRAEAATILMRFMENKDK